MMKKLTSENARNLSWTYNPNGATKEEQRSKGDSVQCTLYSIPENNQLFGRVKLSNGAQHGKVLAEDTCYYYVLSGRVIVYIYGEGSECTIDRCELGENEALIIEKGTSFGYQAFWNTEADVMLIRNYA